MTVRKRLLYARAKALAADPTRTPSQKAAAERVIRMIEVMAERRPVAPKTETRGERETPPKPSPPRDLHAEAERLARQRGAGDHMDEMRAVMIFIIVSVVGETVAGFFPGAAGVGIVTALLLALGYVVHARQENARRWRIYREARAELEASIAAEARKD